ncbi:hypothetical protein QQX98_011376 [Neonectria punicea]|uniref:Ketoreductase (KR) domain-containing protein n=1 Tax=Neonectria punicea TaxID=979145 RepID=A0ABR1GLZ9_9HYPO
MAGTVLITGANGSLGLPFVEHILASHPSYTVIAAVRNPSAAALPRVASIEALDLSSLAAVRTFAARIAARIADGEISPLAAIVCNAFTWSLDGQLVTPDGFEKTFQVGHLAHHLLVLELLGSMAADGRVVMLGSSSHYPERPVPLSRLTAEFPGDVEALVKPLPDEPGDEHDRGFQRYSTAKLASVMFMHDLNRRLQQDPNLSGICVTVMDPGGLVDSRAHVHQKPAVRVMFAVVNALLPLLRRFTTEVRRSVDSARDLVELSVGDRFKGVRGYYVGLKATESALVCKDAEKLSLLWDGCWRWAGLAEDETVLGDAKPKTVK